MRDYLTLYKLGKGQSSGVRVTVVVIFVSFCQLC